MRNNHIFQSLTIKEKLIDILRVIVNMRVDWYIEGNC